MYMLLRPLPISNAFLAFISFARLAMSCDCSHATIMMFQESSIVLWKQWAETSWISLTNYTTITSYDIERLIVPDHSSIPDTKTSLPVWGFSGPDAPSWNDWGHTASEGCLFPHSDFWRCSFWKISFSLRVNMNRKTIIRILRARWSMQSVYLWGNWCLV